MVAVYDTVREVTTITVLVDTEGDTLRIERITDRDDSKLRVISSEVVVKSEAEETERDSLIVTDTTVIYNEPAMNPSEQTDRSEAPMLLKNSLNLHQETNQVKKRETRTKRNKYVQQLYFYNSIVESGKGI